MAVLGGRGQQLQQSSLLDKEQAWLLLLEEEKIRQMESEQFREGVGPNMAFFVPYYRSSSAGAVPSKCVTEVGDVETLQNDGGSKPSCRVNSLLSLSSAISCSAP